MAPINSEWVGKRVGDSFAFSSPHKKTCFYASRIHRLRMIQVSRVVVTDSVQLSLIASRLVYIETYLSMSCQRMSVNRDRVAVSCRTISFINKKVRMIRKHCTIIYFLPIIEYGMFKNQKYGGVLYC